MPTIAHATASAEVYTSESYPYGRFEARTQFTAGDGVVSSFFLWKVGSEVDGAFWNELDIEKVQAECLIKSNALYGDPEMTHAQDHATGENLCEGFHTYAMEWTPDYLAWFIDGVEVRRETGGDLDAFRDNVPDGMRIHLNVWPGDASFGGNFDPAILPVHQYVNWVQYSAYVNGAFELQWREDFGGNSLPAGWNAADWSSPKALSTHAPANVTVMDGYAILSLTADDATGPAGAMPMDPEGPGPLTGTGGEGGAASGGAGGEDAAGGASGAQSGGAGGTNEPTTGGMGGAGPSGGTGPGGAGPSGGAENATGGLSAGGTPVTPGSAGSPPVAPVPTSTVAPPGPTAAPTVTGPVPAVGPTDTTPAPTATAMETPGTAAPSGSVPTTNSDAEPADGCACRAAGADAAKPWGLLALASLALGLFTRRRRSY